MGYNAAMENTFDNTAHARLRALWFVLGLALFWPVVSYRFDPSTLVVGYELPANAANDAISALSGCMLFALGLWLGRRRSWDYRAESRLRKATLLTGATTVALLLASAAWGASHPAFGVGVALASAAYVVLLATSWAIVAESCSARFVVLAAAFSLALNIVIVTIAQETYLPISLGRASRAVLLSFGSGALLWLWRPRKREGLSFCLPSGLSFGKAFARSPLLWVFGALMAYLLLTTVIRTVMSLGLDFEEPLYKSLMSKGILLVFALAMGAIAFAVNRSGTGDIGVSFPWIVFLGSCLAVLYFAIVFLSYAPLLCHEIIFPSRLYANFLLWMVAVVFTLNARKPLASAVCLLFLPALGVTRVFACLVSALAAPVAPSSPVMLLLYVATAGIVTAGAFLYLRASLAQRTPMAAPAAPAAEGLIQVCQQLGRQHDLTEREIEVLALIAEGHGQKKIAEKLFLSPNTVHSYAKTLYRKLGVHNRQEVVDLVRRGLSSD